MNFELNLELYMARQDYKVISSLDLRDNFPIIRKNLERGQKFILMYRGRVIGEIGPTSKEVEEMFGL